MDLLTFSYLLGCAILLARVSLPLPERCSRAIANLNAAFVVVMFTAIMGTRALNHGGDTLVLYLPVFNDLTRCRGNFMEVAQNYQSYDSHLFWLLCYLCAQISRSANLFYTVVIGLLFCIYTRIGSKLRIDLDLLVIVLVSTMLFLMSSTNILRQGVAVALITLSMALFAGKRNRPGVVAALASIGFHTSSAVPLAAIVLTLFWTSKFSLGKKLRLILMFLAVIVVLAPVVYLLFKETLVRKLVFYYVNDFSFSEKKQVARPWVIVSFLLAGANVLLLRFLNGKARLPGATVASPPDGGNESPFTFACWYSVILTMIWSMFLPIPGVFERMGDYVSAIQIVLVCYVSVHLVPRKYTLMYYAALIGVCFLLFDNNYGGSSARLNFHLESIF